MQLFSLGAVVIYCAVSLVVGTRLLRLARRTREWPEFCIGTAYLSGGMLGYPANVAASLLAGSQPRLAYWAYALGQAGMAAAAGLMLVTWFVVFAPKTAGCRSGVGAWIAFLALLTAAVLLSTRPTPARFNSDLYWLYLLVQAGAYALNAWASFRYQALLRRRHALGLARPVVANRMLLWGLSSSMIMLQYLFTVGCILLARVGWPGLYQPGVIGALGLVSAACMTLAFFPPRAYLRRIEVAATRDPS